MRACRAKLPVLLDHQLFGNPDTECCMIMTIDLDFINEIR